MTLSIVTTTAGAGTGTVASALAFTHLAMIANLDAGLGLGPSAGGLTPVTYTQSDPGIPPTRLNTLVNTAFGVDPAGGPDILVLAVGGNFTLNDGSLITTRAGTALSPAGSGGPGATLNPTPAALVVYDTSDNLGVGYCAARASTANLNLPIAVSTMLYHELSHAFRIATNALLALTAACDPSSAEERAAIIDENDMRAQVAALIGDPVVLRNPAIHCGGACPTGTTTSCCIVASVATGSPLSADLAELRRLRDRLLRKPETGFAFFEAFFHSYYSFSPQIATVIAADLELRHTVQDGFVRPLVRMLQQLRYFTLGKIGPEEQGRRFVAAAVHDSDSTDVLAISDRVAELLTGDGKTRTTEAEIKVATLLTERAMTDPYVSYALIDPVQAHHRILRAWQDGETPEMLGSRLAEFCATWTGNLPITAHWGHLSLEETRAELDFLDANLLRDGRSRDAFLTRLRTHFEDVTATSQAVRERLGGRDGTNTQ